LDVSGGYDGENKNVVVWRKHGKLNQQWDIIYADEYPEEPTKGELNKEFGLYVLRDFHIVSEMDSHRYLEVINTRDMVIKTPNAQKGQVWYFDQVSKTIKSKRNNQSFDIQNSGKTRTLQVWSTNSGWW
jgi:patatin-like phospholipase/acyl hydrolase